MKSLPKPFLDAPERLHPTLEVVNAARGFTPCEVSVLTLSPGDRVRLVDGTRAMSTSRGVEYIGGSWTIYGVEPRGHCYWVAVVPKDLPRDQWPQEARLIKSAAHSRVWLEAKNEA